MSPNISKLRRLNRFHISASDLSEALRCAMTLKSLREQGEGIFGKDTKTLEMAAVIGVVVCYARPFVSSKSNGEAERMINLRDFKMFATRPELAELHEEVLVLRHQAIAHSDWTHRSTHPYDTAFEHVRVARIVDMGQLLPDADRLVELVTFAHAAVVGEVLRLAL